MFERRVEPESYYEKTRNMIVEYETPQVRITRKITNLDVVQADPVEYVANYGSALKDVSQMPDFVRDIRPPSGLVLAADTQVPYRMPELEGDLFALAYVDLEREGLGEYRSFLERIKFGGKGISIFFCYWF